MDKSIKFIESSWKRSKWWKCRKKGLHYYIVTLSLSGWKRSWNVFFSTGKCTFLDCLVREMKVFDWEKLTVADKYVIYASWTFSSKIPLILRCAHAAVFSVSNFFLCPISFCIQSLKTLKWGLRDEWLVHGVYFFKNFTAVGSAC